MEATEIQVPLQQDTAAVVTPKKRKPRNRWQKQKLLNVSGEVSVNKPITPQSKNPSAEQSASPVQPHPVNIDKSIVPNCTETSIKLKSVRKRRKYFKDRTGTEAKTVENNSLNLIDPKEVEEKSLEVKVSNNISKSYMDKMKREDDGKSREHILAERDARRLAKQKVQDKSRKLANTSPTKSAQKQDVVGEEKVEGTTDVVTPSSEIASTPQSKTKQLENVTISENTVLSKAERREKQEAQRAAKAKLLAEKAPKSAVQPTQKAKTEKVEKLSEKSPPTKKIVSVKIPQHKVKLFNHLYADKGPENILNSNLIHPAIVKLGAQYINGNKLRSNARCIAFMERIKTVIEDYVTPSQKEFGRGLEAILHTCINYLHQCRPLSVSITNALKFIKWRISQLPANQTDAELKEHLLESVDTYVRDQIEKAAQAISIFVQEKISNGDVILTYGCSSLICHIIQEAQKRNVDFSVIVVDSRPHHEGQEMLRKLVAHKIRCSCVLINAIGFVMPEVTKVLLGANARAGTAQVALMAKFYNVPVLVCCETHKFSERVQTDAFVFNEIGDPQDLVLKTGKYTSNEMQNWKSIPQLTPLNLRYDITPPELVAAVVTELAILPCTSVPVILRIKPSEIGF